MIHKRCVKCLGSRGYIVVLEGNYWHPACHSRASHEARSIAKQAQHRIRWLAMTKEQRIEKREELRNKGIFI